MMSMNDTFLTLDQHELGIHESTAKLARQHNDANVISIGARQHSEDEVLQLIDIFIAEPFSDEERHIRRIGQIADYEV